MDGALAGSVLVAGSPGYESARTPAFARFHHLRPQAIARCHNADDVAETLALARRWGMRAAPRSGGHCFAGRSSTEGIVLDVTPMHAVSVSDATATVGAGARLGEVYDALQQHGVTIPAGCGPTVGIAGLTLGGGIGLLGRKHGLTCDRLVGARVVLADVWVPRTVSAGLTCGLATGLEVTDDRPHGVETALPDLLPAPRLARTAGPRPGVQERRDPRTPT